MQMQGKKHSKVDTLRGFLMRQMRFQGRNTP